MAAFNRSNFSSDEGARDRVRRSEGPAMDLSEQVARVSDAAVTSVARQALGRPSAEVVRWDHQIAYGGYGVARGTNCLLRVTGEAAERGRLLPWSAYLKLTRVPPAESRLAHDQTHNDYW